ncbi:MAG: nucleotidyltransferase family protein [Elusimicrobia bacterium]|nr:nucleotidyltransferase family protein [Elusimicrobiota bacterium]
MIPAAIVAGGRGERMRPETDACPKPMLPIAGKPLLEHQLEWLKRWGVSEAFLCLGYKAEVVSDHFGDGGRWGMKLRYSVEKSPRGTAGCVRDLGDWGGEDLLVVYGDLFVAMDCRKLVEAHRASRAAATLVVWDTDHPHDSDLVRTEGAVEAGGRASAAPLGRASATEGGRITGFYRERKGEPCGTLALAAIWVVRRPLMDLVPADAPSDFGRDIFPMALERGLRLEAYATRETVEDVGTPERRARFLERWGKK